MDPKNELPRDGDQQVIIVRAADFSELLHQVRLSEQRLTEVHRNMLSLQDSFQDELRKIKDVLPLKRRKLSRATRKAHIGCILEKYGGMCPCCREVRIIDTAGKALPGCHEEHYVSRYEVSIDQTWLVCRACNLGKSQGKLSHIDVRAFFEAYQATLRNHLAEKAERLPYQVTLADMLKNAKGGGSPGKAAAGTS